MMTPKQAELWDYLKVRLHVAQQNARMGIPPPGYAYASIPAWLIATGRFYEARPLPADIRPMTPRTCYWNASQLASKSKGRLRYAEGIGHHIIPMEHAWCIDEKDRVVDPTWASPGENAYFGVSFSREEVRQARRGRRELSVIDNWEHDYPLLKELLRKP